LRVTTRSTSAIDAGNINACRRKIEMSLGLQSRDDTRVAAKTTRAEHYLCREVEQAHLTPWPDGLQSLVTGERQQRAWRTLVLKPGVLRAVDLHQLAQAIAPPTWLMRRGKTMPTVLPQPIGDHPTAQGLARHRATVMLGQFLRRQSLPPRRLGIGPKSAYCSRTIDNAKVRTSAWQPMVAGFASALGN
jgi:hypothetical protein